MTALEIAGSEPHPFDICACGHDREEHSPEGVCSEYHAPKPCTSFRLACTAADMAESEAEWQAMKDNSDANG